MFWSCDSSLPALRPSRAKRALVWFTNKFCWGCFRDDDSRVLSDQLKEAYETLRELQLHLRFFNLTFADSVWGFKMFFLTATILHGFSAIRLIHTNPILGCIYLYGASTAIIVYIGLFQSAYQITEKAERLKKLMEIKSGRLVWPVERKYWAGVLRSVPRMGMRIGGFHRVEREVVPVYIDFSVKQIVGLLVSF